MANLVRRKRLLEDCCENSSNNKKMCYKQDPVEYGIEPEEKKEVEYEEKLVDLFAELEEIEEVYKPTTKRVKSIRNDYTVIKHLGEGGYGSVKLCEHNISGKLVACKIVSRENYDPEEVNILRYLSPFSGVIDLQDVYEDGDRMCLVMEYCSHGDVLAYMEKGVNLPSESQLALCFKGLLETLAYCHSKGIVHRDIKLENILISESWSFVLADFGLAKRMENAQSLNGVCGTKRYLAPEIVLGCSYTEKIDVWSAGVGLCFLLTGKLPFQGDTKDEIFDAIVGQEINFEDSRWKNVSPQARDLVSSMLTKNQFMRPSAKKILQHPWFESVSNTLEEKPVTVTRGCGTGSVRVRMAEKQQCGYVV